MRCLTLEADSDKFSTISIASSPAASSVLGGYGSEVEDEVSFNEEAALGAFFALEEEDHEFGFRCSVQSVDDVELDLY